MYQVILNVVCLLLLTVFCSGEKLVYTDCGPAGALKSVDLSPCTTNPCNMKKGVNGTMTINFNPTMDSSSLHSKVFGILAGVPMPFPLPNPDGCLDSNVQCPITKGSPYTYITTLPVLKEYPSCQTRPEVKLANGWNAQKWPTPRAV